MLLENQIENIRHTGILEQVKVYLMLVEQAGDMLEGTKDPGEG